MVAAEMSGVGGMRRYLRMSSEAHVSSWVPFGASGDPSHRQVYLLWCVLRGDHLSAAATTPSPGTIIIANRMQRFQPLAGCLQVPLRPHLQDGSRLKISWKPGRRGALLQPLTDVEGEK